MNIAVFPGSFDPITNAHVDIVLRAMNLFDKIYIAVGVNTTKKGYFSHEERLEIIREVFHAHQHKVEVVQFNGLTVDFCQHVNAQYVLRGIRNAGDFEFEKAIAHNNETLAPDIESVFLISRIGLSHISSTIIREIISSGGDVRTLVPEAVAAYLKKRKDTGE